LSTHSTEFVVSIKGLTKSFGPNKVLKGLNLDIRAGEFLGFMGPNGAGKSTLIKILDGVYDADGGTISYRGQAIRSFASVPQVGFVHQDLGIVDSLTVMENLRLGLPPARLFGPLLSIHKENKLAADAISRVGLRISLDSLAGELSPGEKALLAVARLLSTGAEVLIVDEATSTLPPHDAETFIRVLKLLTEEGATVIFVSHKLSEIRSACVRAALLLDGEIAGEETINAGDTGQLVRMLGSHEQVHTDEASRRSGHSPGEPVLCLSGVKYGSLGPIDLVVREGEVVGLTGLVGSGLHDIAYLAGGIVKAREGSVDFRGKQRALVAPQRETEGSIAEMTVAENMTLSALHKWRGRISFLKLDKEREVASLKAYELNVVPQDIDISLGSLSGGNQQKVLFGRAMLTQAELYVLCEPTRGVDIAARRDLYRVITELRDSGAAIIVVTSDAEDLFAVCDRLAVLDGGQINGPWDHDAVEEDALALIL
jgi:ribose transport system ATP-binding protein